MKCLKEYMARPVAPCFGCSYLCALSSLPASVSASREVVGTRCHYQYLDELLQYIRFGLMDVDTLHTVALSTLVQASETATALVSEALEYHQSIYAQPCGRFTQDQTAVPVGYPVHHWWEEA